MESNSLLDGRFKLLAVVALLLGFLAVALAPSPEAQASTGDQWRRCRQVLVNFQPEGEGGAIAIRTKNVRCFRSRKVVRRCINGNLTRGWRGSYARNRFYLRRGRRLIVYKPVGGGGCLPVRSTGLDRSGGPGMGSTSAVNRLRTYWINLDRDRRREAVVVYNRPNGPMPVSWFNVRDRRRGRWVLVQRVRVTGSPGAPSSGFRNAWVGDLNRDGRVEIAVRDFITPSVGEVLSIYRQAPNRPRFAGMGSVGGDRLGVVLRRGRTAILTVYLTRGHSLDDRVHRERWHWYDQYDSWLCTYDCVDF